MENDLYDYEEEYEEEESPRRTVWIAGGAAAAVLVACLCCVCVAAAFWAGSQYGDEILPGGTPTVGFAPTAVIYFQPTEAMVGQEITFDGTQSQAGSTPIAAYHWDFGDGTTASEAVVTHVYNAAAKYPVYLVVTSEEGLESEAGPAEVTINDPSVPTQPPPGQPPEPVINYPVEAGVGQQVTFDGSGSRPGSSPIAGYTWDLGDGTTGSGPVVTHVYNAPGTYSITLTVTGQDAATAVGGPVQINVTQQAPAPTATIGQLPSPVVNIPSTAAVGQEVIFDGSQSQAGGSPISSYAWDFGDGTTGSGHITTHAYTAAGDYQVLLTVVAEDGLSNTGDPVTISITP
jgi:PKD repeat protein